jgi:hypothetical protein
MATKNIRDQKPANGAKPAKMSGEVHDRDLDKVTGGMAASGLPTGKRMVTSSRTADPCEGGE